MADLEMSNEEAIERILDHMVVHKMAEKRAIKITKALQMAMEALKKQPKNGHWVETTVRGSSAFCCSVCGCESGTLYDYAFCPNCGADMRKGGEKE